MSSNCKVASTTENKFQYRPYGNMFDGTGYDVENPTGKQAASLFATGCGLDYSSDYYPYDNTQIFNVPLGGMMGYGGLGAFGGYGMMPSFCGGFMPGGFMPGGTVANSPAEYMQQMQEYQQQYSDYMVQQQKLNRNAELKVNAPMEGIQGAVTILQDKILKNEQDQIPTAFDNLVEKVRAAYGEGSSESEVKTRAISAYKQLTGHSLIDDIRQNGRTSFTQGVVQSATFGLDDHYSTEDTVARITGSEVASAEKTYQNLGRIAGGATIGTVAGVITKGLSSLAKTSSTTAATTAANAAKKGGKAGLIVGLIVGGAATLMSFLSGKSTT